MVYNHVRGQNMINKIKKLDYSKILFIFLYLQPILDVIYGLSFNYLKIDISLNTIIRFLFMIIAIFYLLFINKDKKIKICTLMIGLYLIIFGIYTLKSKDFDILFYEMKNMLSFFFFPIILLFFINIKDKITIKEKHYFYLNLIYLAFILIPDLLGLGFRSYSEYKSGLIGWFYSSNSVGSIITILVPITMYYLMNNKKYLYLSFYLILTTYIFLSLGTKAPIIGLVITVLLFILRGFIKSIQNKKYKYIYVMIPIIILSITASIIFVPKTSAYKNMKMHLALFKINSINEALNSKDFWNHIIFSQRLLFLEKTSNNYNNSAISTKLLGLGFVENYKLINENYKTIEIDYFDIFYRCGFIGSFIYIFTIVVGLIVLLKDKIKYNFKNYAICISLFLSILLAFFCGHVFTGPATAIIIGYIIMKLDKKLV